MRVRTFCRFATSLALLAALAVVPTEARAEADLFGTGDGHSGALVAAGADEVVNVYAAVTADAAAGATQIAIGPALGNAAGFAPNDLVLVWRATGVAAADAPSASATALDLGVVAGGAVGRYELARVATVAADTLTLTKPLVAAFAKDVSQVVRIPEYTTVDVPAGTSLAALPWQSSGTGFAGGILAFVATGVVTVDGRVHADARGFRGGTAVQRIANLPLSCQNDDGTVEQGYAPKGEGVVSTEFGPGKGGRGNRSIAAGGGNCVENGGGGGGNAGAGGKGGESVVTGIGGTARGGLGGAKIDYSLLARMSLGGGGGAGEQKNGLGSSGGAGGGAVLVRARSLAGAGVISANGEGAQNAQLIGLESDGAGGGGAGGSILVRLVGTATCASMEATGGKGGDAQQVGLSLFGPGGGGGGGRVLVQSSSSQACPVDTSAGAKGVANGTDRNAGSGAGGTSEPLPAPGGNYCFANTATDPQCADPSPVCDPVTGFCHKCTGPFGAPSPHSCGVAVEPVCMADGSCVPCNGDFASGTTQACQLAGSPYCFTAGASVGACGKCSTDADCVGHSGPKCNPTVGACGTACTDDSQCKGSEWCAQNVCVPKTPNGEAVPNVSPIDGECTPEKGRRVCISAACEPGDDLCGLQNGSPCEGVDERCRNGICFDADERCGKPSGEPCTGNGECRSDLCKDGVCAGCDDDTDCPSTKRCDVATKQCVDRPDAGGDGSSGGGGAGDGGPDTRGIVEGGGCACNTTSASVSSPLALAVVALLAVKRMARPRRRRGDGVGKEQA